MPATSPALAFHRSRITNGRELLPGIDGRSVWARLMRDQLEALTAHCGGPDYLTEPQRMTARRAAALEAELIFLEAKIAEMRGAGKEPPERLVDLYSRIANGQRRHLEALGFQRVQRDVTPTLESYLAGKAAPAE